MDMLMPWSCLRHYHSNSWPKLMPELDFRLWLTETAAISWLVKLYFSTSCFLMKLQRETKEQLRAWSTASRKQPHSKPDLTVMVFIVYKQHHSTPWKMCKCARNVHVAMDVEVSPALTVPEEGSLVVHDCDLVQGRGELEDQVHPNDRWCGCHCSCSYTGHTNAKLVCLDVCCVSQVE